MDKVNYHFKKGDPKPKIDDEKLTLFLMRFCPFCERVRYVLSFYKIEHDVIFINLYEKPDWYLELLPSGKVPLLLHQGQKLAESDIIMMYLDQKDQSLMKVCGEEGFKTVSELWGKIFKSFYEICFKNEGDKTEAFESWKKGCDDINAYIKGPFLFGAEVSLADLLLFPVVDRWECVMASVMGRSLQEAVGDGEPLNDAEQRWPRLHAYREAMRAEQFVRAVRVPTRSQGLFTHSRCAGQPKFDMPDV